MSVWRETAILLIPKQRALVERSESIGMLWAELWFAFVKAHRDPVDIETIRGAYEFARWTLEYSREDDMATATCCHFYEHLTEDPLVRSMAPNFMTRAEALGMSEIFQHHLNPEQCRQFLNEFTTTRNRR